MTKYKFEDIAYNSTEKKKPVEEDKYTYIGLEHLDPQCLEVTRYGSEVAPIGEKLVMKKGDVLFGKRRAYQKKVAIAPFDGIFSAHGMVLRPKEKVIDPKFFPMFIASDYFLDSAIKISVGSLSPTINWSALKELEFELPDLNKQHELAELLWAAEETKQAYKNLIDKSKGLIQAKFVELFNSQNKNLYSNEKIENVSKSLFAGGDKPIDYSKEKNAEYRYPVYSNGELMDGLLCYAKTCQVNETALTISARGTIGITKIREAGFTPVVRLITLIPNEKVNIYFLKHYIDNISLKGNGSSQGQLTLPELKKIDILVPSIESQTDFAKFYLLNKQSQISLQKSIENIENVIKSIINENFNEEVSHV